MLMTGGFAYDVKQDRQVVSLAVFFIIMILQTFLVCVWTVSKWARSRTRAGREWGQLLQRPKWGNPQCLDMHVRQFLWHLCRFLRIFDGFEVGRCYKPHVPALMAFSDGLQPNQIWAFLGVFFQNARKFKIAIEPIKFDIWNDRLLKDGI